MRLRGKVCRISGLAFLAAIVVTLSAPVLAQAVDTSTLDSALRAAIADGEGIEEVTSQGSFYDRCDGISAAWANAHSSDTPRISITTGSSGILVFHGWNCKYTTSEGASGGIEGGVYSGSKRDSSGNWYGYYKRTGETGAMWAEVSGHCVTAIGNYSNVSYPYNGNTYVSFMVEGIRFYASPGGSGTKTDPYRISDIEDLLWLRDCLDAGIDFGGRFVRLDADVDVSDSVFAGMGKNKYGQAFRGTFDGNGHTIEGLATPLFAELGSDAAIENLVVEGSITETSYTGEDAGLLAATLPTNVAVSNCAALGSVSGAGNVGGIAGSSSAQTTIAGCYSAVSVSTVSTDAESGAGGIVGHAQDTRFSDCSSCSTVTGGCNAGGIVGLATSSGSDSHAEISSCLASGPVSAKGYNSYAGGIAGKLAGTISSCLAVNPKISSSGRNVTGCGRVFGDAGSGSGNDNYAWNDMQLAGAELSVGAGQKDGAELTRLELAGTALVAPVRDWSTSVWVYAAGTKPLLSGIAFELQDLNWPLWITGADLTGATVTAANQVYTGLEQTPDVTVTLANGRVLNSADVELNCDVSYSSNIDAGTAQVSVAGTGACTGSATGSFAIVSSSLEGASVTVEDQVFTGGKIEPAVTVSLASVPGLKADDYDVVFLSNVDAGTATAVVMGKGNCYGSAQATFQIVPVDISGATVSVPEQLWVGTAVEPSLDVSFNGNELVRGVDYTCSFINNVDPGTALVTITGTGNYTGSVAAKFSIVKRIISLEGATVAVADQTWTGAALEPEVSVTLADGTVADSAHYDIAYSDNAEVGTAAVTVTGKSTYTGTASGTFAIQKRSLEGAKVDVAGQMYTGRALEPEVTVTCSDGLVVPNACYEVAYANNIGAGTATVVVTGTGSCTGTASGTFEIAPASLEGATVVVGSQTYTGEALEPSVVVVDSTGAVVDPACYDVSYQNNVQVGTATVVATGKGNYTGAAEGAFSIVSSDLDDLKAQLETVKAELAQTQAELEQAKSGLAAAQETQAAAESERDAAVKKAAESEAAAKAASEERTQALADRDAALADKATAEAAEAAAKTAQAQAEADVLEAQKKQQEAEAASADARVARAQAESERDEAKAALDEANATLASAQEDLAEAQAAQAAAEQQSAEYEQAKKDAEAAQVEAEQRAKEAEEKAAAAVAAQQRAEEAGDAAQAAEKKAVDERDAAKAAQEQAEADRDAALSAQSAAKADLEQAQASLGAANAKLVRLTADLETANENLVQAETEKKATENARDEALAAQKAAESEAASAKEAAEKAVSERDAALKQAEESAVTAKEASDEKTQAIADRDAALAAKAEAEAARAKAEQDAMEAKLAQAKAETDAATARAEAAEAKLAQAIAEQDAATAKEEAGKAQAQAAADSSAREAAERKAEEAAAKAAEALSAQMAAEQKQAAAEDDLKTAEERASKAEAEAAQAKQEAGEADKRVQEAEQRAKEADERVSQAEQRAAQAELRAAQAESERDAALKAQKDAADALVAAQRGETSANGAMSLSGLKLAAGVGSASALYTVIRAASASGVGAVVYARPLVKNKARTAAVPAFVYIRGHRYQVIGISKSAFKKTARVKTVTVKTAGLSKKSVKGSLKGSKVKTIKVKVGSKKQNKNCIKKYKKIFTKKNAGKKVKVK